MPGFLAGGGHQGSLDHRDVRRDQAAHRQPPLGRRAVLPAHRQAAGADASPRWPIVFKPAPHLPFTAQATEELTHNALVIRVQPDEGTTLRFGAKVPGTALEIRDVNMDFAYGGSFVEASPEAYERLILDVLLGDPPLFPQHEEVELSWRILDPIIDYWAAQGRPTRAVPLRRLGPGVRQRDAGARRPDLEAALMTSPHDAASPT